MSANPNTRRRTDNVQHSKPPSRNCCLVFM